MSKSEVGPTFKGYYKGESQRWQEKSEDQWCAGERLHKYD